MKAIRRSLSPFRRRRKAKELLDEIKLKEAQHLLTIQQVPTYDESLTNSTGSMEASLTALPPTTKRKWFRKTNRQVVTPHRRNLRGSRSLSPPSSIAPSSIRSPSLDRAVPMQRSKESMTDASVLNIAQALRYVETEICSARKMGKRVSRTKVMGALLSVVDHMDVEPDVKEPPLEFEAPTKITVIEYTPPEGDNNTDTGSTDSSLSRTIGDDSTSTEASTTDDDTNDDDFKKKELWLMDSFADVLLNSISLTSPPLQPSPQSKRTTSPKRRSASERPQMESKPFTPCACATPTTIEVPTKIGSYAFTQCAKSEASKKSKKIAPPEPLVVQRTRSRSKTPRNRGPHTPRRDDPAKRSSYSSTRREKPEGVDPEKRSRSNTPPEGMPITSTRDGPASVTPKPSSKKQNPQIQTIRDAKQLMTRVEGPSNTSWSPATTKHDAALVTMTITRREGQAKGRKHPAKTQEDQASGSLKQPMTRPQISTMTSWLRTFNFAGSDQYHQALADIFFFETKSHGTRQDSRNEIAAEPTPPIMAAVSIVSTDHKIRTPSRTKKVTANDERHHQNISPRHDDDAFLVFDQGDWPNFSSSLREDMSWPE